MTNEPTIWSDDPPSEAGEYRVKRWDGREMTAIVYEQDGQLIFESSSGARFVCAIGLEEMYQFGPRVLSAEQTVDLLAKVERLERENAELRRNAPLDDATEIKRFEEMFGPTLSMTQPNGIEFCDGRYVNTNVEWMARGWLARARFTGRGG